jgi:hypothetical protein
MIINALDFGRAFIGPQKAETVLIVHSDRVLLGAISKERFEAITWWTSKVAQRVGGVEHGELAFEDGSNVGVAATLCSFKDGLRLDAPKRDDRHVQALAQCT